MFEAYRWDAATNDSSLNSYAHLSCTFTSYREEPACVISLDVADLFIQPLRGNPSCESYQTCESYQRAPFKSKIVDLGWRYPLMLNWKLTDPALLDRNLPDRNLPDQNWPDRKLLEPNLLDPDLLDPESITPGQQFSSSKEAF
jgi:hypothetical protein